MPLTLAFKQHDLHPVERERLSEAVSHRVLLFLENLGHLESREENILRREVQVRADKRRGEERRGLLPLGGH